MEWMDRAVGILKGLPDWWTGIAVAIVVAVALTALIRKLRRASAAATTTRRPAGPAVGAARELHKLIARLESENTAFSNFFKYLPDFTKEINSRLDRRAIAPLILKIIDQLLTPSQILIFFIEERSGSLVLVNQKGLAPAGEDPVRVGVGEGRIGWVARHKMAMDVDDFIREIRHSGETLEAASHFGFKTELCAPMVHEGKVLGVISVGGITRHSKYEKNMLTLLGDLGSIALYNNHLFSLTQEMANCDGLTKLYNKRFFMDRLGDAIRRAEQTHNPVSLFIFDLDNFKHYNDTQGHQAGDEVLKITGHILRDTVRPEDIPARYGGEEFIVIWERTSKDDAMAAAERIRARVAAHEYPNRESQPLKVISLSGGVATFPDDGLSGSDLIKAADAALYRAKKAGRNRVLRSEPQYFSDESDNIYYNVTNG